MKIAGLTKVSLLDFPNKISAIIFTSGCNFACPYCHNYSIAKNKYTLLDENEVVNYLKKRSKILEGVVITGGEPLMQPDLIDFIKKIKNLGLSVKLDTNGYLPNKLKQVLETNLIDYVAMDIKAKLEDYSKITATNNIDTSKLLESIKIISNSNVDHEFRTTFIKTYHKIDDVIDICKLIKPTDKYYIQSFKDSQDVFNHSLTSFSDEELNIILNKARQIVKNAELK